VERRLTLPAFVSAKQFDELFQSVCNWGDVGAVSGIREYSLEPKMKVEEIAEVAVLMATLPPHMNMLEAIVLPVKQAYLGRG